jgi:hypothetical protein
MATIVTRAGKGSPLTNAEVDANFTNLNSDKIEPADVRTLTNKTIDSITNTIGADHIHFKVKASAAISKGQPVKFVGYNSGANAFEVAPTSSSLDVAIGLSHDTLASGHFGAIINTGVLEGFDTSSFAEGSVVYPNASGGLSATQPSSGTYQAIAYVLRSHANNGAVLVEATEPAAVRTSSNVGNTVVLRDGSGNFSAGAITASLLGNASTASALATSRLISLSGDASGSASFDGSSNAIISLTLANSGVTAGTYTKVTVDAKGRVTTGDSLSSADLPTYTGTLTSGQITTGLGFTPYNATNPNGYTSNTGTVTSVSGAGTVSGLTLSGTVTGSGSLTLGGSITGFLPTSGGTLTGDLTIQGVAPILYFAETDQTLPAGRRRFVLDGNGFSLRRNTAAAGNYSTEVNDFSVDASSNFVAAGNVTAYSDERLKKDWTGLPADFVERLATVKSGTYARIDSGERQAGSSAQDWLRLLPEVVSTGTDKDKTLAMAYGNAALVSVVELAKRVIALEAKLAAMQS